MHTVRVEWSAGERVEPAVEREHDDHHGERDRHDLGVAQVMEAGLHAGAIPRANDGDEDAPRRRDMGAAP